MAVEQIEHRTVVVLTEDEILNEVRSCHTKSMTFAAKAVAEDEAGNKNEAMVYYLKALKHLEDGILHEIHNARYCGAEWDIARDLQQGMMSTLQNVKQRIYELQSVGEEVPMGGPLSEDPPQYSVQDPLSAGNLQANQVSTMNVNATAEPLLVIESGVQMYFVSTDNLVGATPPTYPTFLKIALITEGYIPAQCPQAILQVGDWLYPLAKNHMPVLRSANGAYIFPNCNTDGIQQGSAIGIVISNVVGREYIEMFESLLHNYAVFQTEDPDDGFVDLTEYVRTTPEWKEEDRCLSDRISTSVMNGAEVIGHGVRKGTEYATELVEKGSEKITSNLSPYTTPLVVYPAVKKGLLYAHEASNTAVCVSRWLVDWLCAITSKVGEQIAPYLKTNDDDPNPGNASSQGTCGLLKVAGAGLIGFGKIWLELEKAGSAIAKAVTSATTKNVEFRYGPEAGQAADLAMGAVVNIGATAFTLDNLGIKTVAEVSTKDSGPRAVYNQTSETVFFESCHDRKILE